NAPESDDSAATAPVEEGPKTTDSPTDSLSSSDIFDTLDIFPDLTDGQQQCLQDMIIRNQSAFSLDGKLGTHKTQMEIKLKTEA
ncbi:uncharacterized protein BT62DRAFT_901566, partial [Guyanagaster necrorhizus]